MAQSGPMFGADARQHIQNVLVASASDYEQIVDEVVDVLRRTGDEPMIFAMISTALAKRGLNFALVMGTRAMLEAARARMSEEGLNGLN